MRNEFERLYAWDVDVADLSGLRVALRRRPEYPAAARRLAANMLADAEADPALGGLLRDAGRTVAALSAVGLGAVGPGAVGLSASGLGASGGLTLAGLKSFIAGFGLVSAGRAQALLNLMLHLRYVQADGEAAAGAGGCDGDGISPAARLAKTYSLTPAFLASYARHEASLLDAVAVVEPAARCLARGVGAPAVLGALANEQGRTFAAGSGEARDFEDWYRVFMHRLAGIQVLHALVARADSFPPAGPIAASAAELARRFDVSRVHVSRMLADGAAHGFLVVEPGAVRFTPAGREALDWLYASRLCVHLACAARTLKAYPELSAAVAPGADPLAQDPGAQDLGAQDPGSRDPDDLQMADQYPADQDWRRQDLAG